LEIRQDWLVRVGGDGLWEWRIYFSLDLGVSIPIYNLFFDRQVRGRRKLKNRSEELTYS
jgi:hypothetical protein